MLLRMICSITLQRMQVSDIVDIYLIIQSVGVH